MLNSLREFPIRSERHLRRYVRLIEHYKGYRGEGENHHILPRSMWPDHFYRSDNIVRLPLRAHFIAHYLLWKTYRNEPMVLAFQQMSRVKNGRHNQSRLYREGKLDFRRVMRGKKWWHNPSNGDLAFSKVCPEGYVEGNGRPSSDFKPKKLEWWHFPDGKAFRVDPEIGPPEGAVKGRSGFKGGRGLDRANASVNCLDIIEKKYVSLKPGELKWNHAKTTGVSIDKRVVIVWEGVKYLSWSRVPAVIPRNTRPEEFIAPIRGPVSPTRKAFIAANTGSTYASLGLVVEPFINHVFKESDEVVI